MAPSGPIAWVVDYGWHTELIIPAEQATGPLAPIARELPGAQTLSFGFGKTTFMSNPHPGAGDFLAGAVPGSASIRVLGLPSSPDRLYNDPVDRLALTPAQSTALIAFLARSIARDPDGTPHRSIPDPDRNTRFYQATRGYSLAYTCNAWSAEGLAEAGFPVHGTILFSSGLMGAVARVQGACATTHGRAGV